MKVPFNIYKIQENVFKKAAKLNIKNFAFKIICHQMN